MATGHCHAITKSVGMAASIQFATNSMLFLFRIRAVFFGQRVVVIPFSILWLAIAGTSLLYPITYDGTTLGTTNICVGTRLDVTSSIAVIVSAVFDTLTFLAITIRLSMSNYWGTSWSSWARILITGEGMGRVSQIMMQTGQSYYLSVYFISFFTREDHSESKHNFFQGNRRLQRYVGSLDPHANYTNGIQRRDDANQRVRYEHNGHDSLSSSEAGNHPRHTVNRHQFHHRQ